MKWHATPLMAAMEKLRIQQCDALGIPHSYDPVIETMREQGVWYDPDTRTKPRGRIAQLRRRSSKDCDPRNWG